MTGKTWGSRDTLNILSTSDIHFAHPRVPTATVVDSLNRLIPDNEETGKLDLIVIPGDMTERGISLHEYDTILIDRWMIRLLRLCKKWSIVLRVSEGTGSHDRKQAARIMHLNKISGIGADVQYWETLTIEHIDVYDIDVLYVPDNYKVDPEDTWVDVQAALKAKGLEKVDFALMHGFFEHQVPSMSHGTPHKNDRYLSIVRKYIFNGHHHTPVVKDRIIVQGSPERLGFGQEEPKGCFLVECMSRTDAANDTVKFVENKLAVIFNTYIVDDDTTEAALGVILDAAGSLAKGSNVWIKISRGSKHMPAVEVAAARHKDIRWKIEPGVTKKKISREVINITPSKTVREITGETVMELVKERLVIDAVSEEDAAYALKLLGGLA